MRLDTKTPYDTSAYLGRYGRPLSVLTFFFGFFQVGSDVPCELLHKAWLCRVSVPVGIKGLG